MITHSPAETRDLGRRLAEHLQPGDVILFKGSRGMRMELALEKFLQEET